MNVNLKNYQEKAIKDLIVNFKSFLLEKEHKKLCIFQAPTGSGKTLIVAKFIEELIKELSQIDLCFV
ncbi:MAG: DEAD/DEAH box helicase family protein [Mollicutes bacterium]|nr:MAG: DEAD/DEAH box helicase family protein [Mollicutes bacterium]